MAAAASSALAEQAAAETPPMPALSNEQLGTIERAERQVTEARRARRITIAEYEQLHDSLGDLGDHPEARHLIQDLANAINAHEVQMERPSAKPATPSNR